MEPVINQRTIRRFGATLSISPFSLISKPLIKMKRAHEIRFPPNHKPKLKESVESHEEVIWLDALKK